MYMFLYSVIILKTPSFIVLPHIFNSYDSLIKQYTPNHVDFNTFFRTTHEIHIKILQIEEPSLQHPKKTKNPNPSPIGNRFGFFLFGGRGWIRTTEAEKQQIYSLSPLATREHAHIRFPQPRRLPVYVTTESAICQPIIWAARKNICENHKSPPVRVRFTASGREGFSA